VVVNTGAPGLLDLPGFIMRRLPAVTWTFSALTLLAVQPSMRNLIKVSETAPRRGFSSGESAQVVEVMGLSRLSFKSLLA